MRIEATCPACGFGFCDAELLSLHRGARHVQVKSQHQQNKCECGGIKSSQSTRCRSCWNKLKTGKPKGWKVGEGGQRKQHVCACGRPMSKQAQKCVTCRWGQPAPETRRCCVCLKDKPLNAVHFYRNVARKWGYRNECAECMRSERRKTPEGESGV
jgi:hypothetical protein